MNLFYLNRREKIQWSPHTYKYSSPKNSLPGFTVTEPIEQYCSTATFNGSTRKDFAGFPFFEEDNHYLGWLVHCKALLRSPDYQDALYEECPKAPIDDNVDPPVLFPCRKQSVELLSVAKM
jgi:hypothetical protein